MSIETDAYEVDPRDYRELGRQMDNRHRGNGSIYNGSTTFINFMLSVIVILLAGAISFQIKFNMNITEELATLKTTVTYMVEGQILGRPHGP